MDWAAIGGVVAALATWLVRLERRLSRIETDVRWLREATEQRREEFHGAH